jgi:hypothetical protein
MLMGLRRLRATGTACWKAIFFAKDIKNVHKAKENDLELERYEQDGDDIGRGRSEFQGTK